MSTDVCGSIVERMSGQPLDEFFRTRIFEPLGMHDTGFCAPESQTDRCSVLYAYAPGKGMRPTATAAAMNTTAGDAVGGGGLVSSTDDYLQFCHMLLNGGELNGARLLSPRTLRFMTT